MRWPRIAVVIATYGKTETLRLAVESALRQDYPDTRLLIIVDGNAAQFSELVALYRDEPRIAVHDLMRNTGEQSGPNNLGVALTDADLIAFLNHDDLWFPDHLRLLSEVLLTRQADVAFSQAAGVSPENGPIERAEDCAFYLTSRLPGGRYRPFYSFVGVSNWLIRKEAFEALGGFRPARDCLIATTQDFLNRSRRAGFAFAYVDEITSIAVHSGIRAGSYCADFDPREQRVLSARLFACGADAMRSLIIPRLGPDGRAAFLDWFVRLTGFPLMLATPRYHGMRRGYLINRVRGIRGLPPLGDQATTVAAFVRRHQDAHMPRIAVGEPAHFARENLQPLFAEGWYLPEPWGRWAAGQTARLRFSVAGTPGQAIAVIATCVFPPGLAQWVRVRTQTSPASQRWLRLAPNTTRTTALAVTHRLTAAEEVVTLLVQVLFRFRVRGSGGSDRRRLGVGLSGLTVTPAPGG
jgi:hypothetical protein